MTLYELVQGLLADEVKPPLTLLTLSTEPIQIRIGDYHNKVVRDFTSYHSALMFLIDALSLVDLCYKVRLTGLRKMMAEGSTDEET